MNNKKAGYKFIDHTADVMFEAYGSDLNELFENSGLALQELQVELKNVKSKIIKEIKLENKSVEMLLFDFLQELIFLKDTEQLIFSKIKVKIKDDKLNGVCSGEKIDINKHECKVDAKAITLHKYEVKKIKDKWIARVIVDI